MNKPISPELLAKLKDVEGEGLSRDPKNNPRKIIRLLQDKDEGSKWFPSGARPGQYLIDERPLRLDANKILEHLR